MNYLILHENSEAKAKELSERIWAVKNPNPPAGTVTKAYTGFISHADGRVALSIIGEATATTVEGEIVISYSDAMRVDSDADIDALINAVGDSVTADERTAMKSMLESAKGDVASLLQFAMTIPSLQQRLRTHEQMEADGWFTNSEM